MKTSFKCDPICSEPLFLEAEAKPLGGSGRGTGTGTGTSTGVFKYLRVFKS